MAQVAIGADRTIAALYYLGLRRRQRNPILRIVGWSSWALWLSLRDINHPLCRDRRVRSVVTMWAWQLWRRLAKRSVVVHLPEGTKLICPPWSGLASAWITAGFHEYTETLFVLDFLRQGDLFIDIGANLGYYSIIAARLGASCLAVEPGRRTCALLAANVSLNGVQDRIQIFAYAIADFEGAALFSDGVDVTNHLVAGGDEADTALRVEVHMLDELFHDRVPALLKIDAEGYDLSVLHGASQIIRGCRPVILIEIWQGGGSVREWLEACDYGIYWYEPTMRALIPVPVSFSGQATFIAVPRDRHAAVEAALFTGYRPRLGRPQVSWR